MKTAPTPEESKALDEARARIYKEQDIMSDQEEMVTVTKAYLKRLERDAKKVTFLENAGVGNWEWYGDALEKFWEEEEE